MPPQRSASRSTQAAGADAAAINRSALRDALNALLKTESDFDAFCLDYFEDDVFRHLGAGMERVAKTNQLLARAEPAAIVSKLRERYGERLKPYEAALGGPTRPARRPPAPKPAAEPSGKPDVEDYRAIGQAILKRAADIATDSLSEFELVLPSRNSATIKLNTELLTADKAYIHKLRSTFDLIKTIEAEIEHLEMLMKDPYERAKDWKRLLIEQQQHLKEKLQLVQATVVAVTVGIELSAAKKPRR